MARILDTISRSARPAMNAEATVTVDRSNRMDADVDPDDVPFIEVGGLSPKHSKTNVERTAHPAIIPISRPASRPSPSIQPQAESQYVQISFQSLPLTPQPLESLESRLAPDVVAYHHPDHPASEQYLNFAHELEAQLGSEPGKSVLFTSAYPSSGTTSVLLNLAVTLARQNASRVIVVDAQFARPSCSARLGLANAPGLREALARRVPLVWAIQETGLTNLHLLSNGDASIEPQMEIWQTIFDQLRQRFDWILIDAPEWGTRPETLVMSASCAGTYLVLRPDDTTNAEVNDLLSEIPRQGGQFRGYILAHR